MLRDITLGRYIKADSPLHKADPRTKAICAIAFSVAVFICDTLFAQLAALIFIILSATAAKIQLKYLFKGLKPLSLFLLFMFLINTFTDGNIYHAALVTMKFVLFTLGASVFTLTTEPIALTDGFASLIKPLRIFRIPTDAIAMIISITLRLIPTFADEYERISKAYRARGFDSDNKGLVSKIKSASVCVLPLFISTFRHTDELALAMDARCYGKLGRKPRKKLKFTKIDCVTGIIMMFFCVFLAFIEFLH